MNIQLFSVSVINFIPSQCGCIVIIFLSPHLSICGSTCTLFLQAIFLPHSLSVSASLTHKHFLSIYSSSLPAWVYRTIPYFVVSPTMHSNSVSTSKYRLGFLQPSASHTEYSPLIRTDNQFSPAIYSNLDHLTSRIFSAYMHMRLLFASFRFPNSLMEGERC